MAELGLYLRAWTFLVTVSACVYAKPLTSPSGLEDILAARIQENTERDGNVHGHIVAVNGAHREVNKRTVDYNAASEAIEVINEGTDEDSDLFEGDILTLSTDKRNVMATTSKKRWPGHVVPYYLPPEMEDLRPNLRAAIAGFKARTCVRFKEVPESYSGDFIRFTNKGGCASHVGRVGGGQTLKLGRGCNIKGVVIHEIMHALGVFHEQSRPDRDMYVQILWSNIKKGKIHNFKKYSHDRLDTLGLPYDMHSLMHYDRYLFSKDRRSPTIVARGRPWVPLGGQSRGTFTDNDAKEVNSLFGC